MNVNDLPIAGPLNPKSNQAPTLVQEIAENTPENIPQIPPKPESVTLTKVDAYFSNLSFSERNESDIITNDGGFKAWGGASDITDQYKESIKNIRDIEPDLLNKEWDIGVNSDNELVIETGGNGISASEAQLLIDQFDNEAFKAGIKNIQDGVIRMSEAHYDYSGVVGSPSHYNLNNDNITKAINIRDILDGYSTNGPGSEFNLFDELPKQLQNNANEFLKPEVKTLNLIDTQA